VVVSRAKAIRKVIKDMVSQHPAQQLRKVSHITVNQMCCTSKTSCNLCQHAGDCHVHMCTINVVATSQYLLSAVLVIDLSCCRDFLASLLAMCFFTSRYLSYSGRIVSLSSLVCCRERMPQYYTHIYRNVEKSLGIVILYINCLIMHSLNIDITMQAWLDYHF